MMLWQSTALRSSFVIVGQHSVHKAEVKAWQWMAKKCRLWITWYVVCLHSIYSELYVCRFRCTNIDHHIQFDLTLSNTYTERHRLTTQLMFAYPRSASNIKQHSFNWSVETATVILLSSTTVGHSMLTSHCLYIAYVKSVHASVITSDNCFLCLLSSDGQNLFT